MGVRALFDSLVALECDVLPVDGVRGHVLVTRGTFRAILPVTDPGEDQAPLPPSMSNMFSMQYPVTLQADDDGTLLVTFPDFSGSTSGRDREEALQRAAAFLVDAMAIYRAHEWPIPCPAIRDGEHVTVPVPLPDDPLD